jgi:preprotein translocase subunit SecG
MAVILIQNPKGGGVDSTFGGQSANQMFGAAKSVDFIEKLTWGLAAALFSLCIFATSLSSKQNPSQHPISYSGKLRYNTCQPLGLIAILSACS